MVLVVDIELKLHLLLHVIELQWFDLHHHLLFERIQEQYLEELDLDLDEFASEVWNFRGIMRKFCTAELSA